MSELAEVLARLERLEAIQAVQEVFYAYARCVRREAFADIPALFAPDGRFEVRAGQPDSAAFSVKQVFASPAELVAFLETGRGKPHPVPFIDNIMVEVSGDTASANALMVAPITGTDKEVRGEYHDTFLRRDGQWLFQQRIYTMYAN